MWYDLSPMRPDDYAKTEARRWIEALALRRAGQDGMEQAASEKRSADKLTTLARRAEA